MDPLDAILYIVMANLNYIFLWYLMLDILFSYDHKYTYILLHTLYIYCTVYVYLIV